MSVQSAGQGEASVEGVSVFEGGEEGKRMTAKGASAAIEELLEQCREERLVEERGGANK